MVKYVETDVWEYWIVDLKHETVVCYYFKGEDYPVMYTFRDKIPTRIFDVSLEQVSLFRYCIYTPPA